MGNPAKSFNLKKFPEIYLDLFIEAVVKDSIASECSSGATAARCHGAFGDDGSGCGTVAVEPDRVPAELIALEEHHVLAFLSQRKVLLLEFNDLGCKGDPVQIAAFRNSP